MTSTVRLPLVAVLAALLLTACEDPAGLPLRGHTVELPEQVHVVPMQSLELPLIVRDAGGTPVEGVRARWRSTDTTVASVGPDGVLTTRNAGSAHVTAEVDGVRATAWIRVWDRELHAWPDSLAVLPGIVRTLTARALPSNGGTVALEGVRWESSDPAVARVDAEGRVTAVAAGRATVTAVAGDRRMPAEVHVVTYPEPLRFDTVATGGAYACGLTAGGQAYCWGSGEYGQLGLEQPTDRCERVVTGLKGEFWRTTYRCSEIPVRLGSGVEFASLSAGREHVCGVTTTGGVFCWGDNYGGALGRGTHERVSAVPAPVSGSVSFRSVSAGSNVTCGVSTSGAAFCWGANFHGALGNGTRVDAASPVPVDGDLRFAQVDAGGSHVCGVTLEGAPYCWGSNASGQLGVAAPLPETCAGPHIECATRPVAVSGDLRFTSVGAETGFSCGLGADGRAHCWGQGYHGRLGNGAQEHSRVPVPVAAPAAFAALSVGQGFACGVDAAGAAFCWGANVLRADGIRHIATPTPTRSHPLVPLRSLSAGYQVCGVGRDGIAVCWAMGDSAPVPGQ